MNDLRDRLLGAIFTSSRDPQNKGVRDGVDVVALLEEAAAALGAVQSKDANTLRRLVEAVVGEPVDSTGYESDCCRLAYEAAVDDLKGDLTRVLRATEQAEGSAKAIGATFDLFQAIHDAGGRIEISDEMVERASHAYAGFWTNEKDQDERVGLKDAIRATLEAALNGK